MSLRRLYIAYCSWFVLGSILCMQLPTVGAGATHSMPHMPALAVFGILQVREAARVCGQHISDGKSVRVHLSVCASVWVHFYVCASMRVHLCACVHLCVCVYITTLCFKIKNNER